MHAYKILVIRYFHIVYSDEQWLSLIISTREAQQLICVECDFWQRPEDECALNLAHVVLEHGLWFECASQLEAISDLQRLAQRLRNGFVVIVRCQQLRCVRAQRVQHRSNLPPRQLASDCPGTGVRDLCLYSPLLKCRCTWRTARFSW